MNVDATRGRKTRMPRWKSTEDTVPRRAAFSFVCICFKDFSESAYCSPRL